MDQSDSPFPSLHVVLEEGTNFDLVYRGKSEVDRHYTKPMLPWIISEIKNQNKLEKVC